MVRLASIVIDCYDAQGLSQFWAAALGASAGADFGEYVVLQCSPSLVFQAVPEPTPGKNRVHVDLETDDLAAERDRLVALGASVIEFVQMRGGSWYVLADPEGNQFCVTEPFDPDRA